MVWSTWHSICCILMVNKLPVSCVQCNLKCNVCVFVCVFVCVHVCVCVCVCVLIRFSYVCSTFGTLTVQCI